MNAELLSNRERSALADDALADTGIGANGDGSNNDSQRMLDALESMAKSLEMLCRHTSYMCDQIDEIKVDTGNLHSLNSLDKG